MVIHLKLFCHYILKRNSSICQNNPNYHLNSTPSPSFLSEHNELTITICRFLFLFARFGDSLLLTRLPDLIKKYFPCWCHFNSKLLRKQQAHQRPSHQILMKNTDSSTNEPLSLDDLANSNDLPNQQELQRRRRQRSSRMKHRRFRLRFQFVPIWSNKRQRLFTENY